MSNNDIGKFFFDFGFRACEPQISLSGRLVANHSMATLQCRCGKERIVCCLSSDGR